MTLASGTRIGQYEVVAPIGAGGMGEVYRAQDKRLHRFVALKVLPELVAGDPQRTARFEREAQLLASLNHPHIAQIYGVEESASTSSGQAALRALVMELVDGRTLSELIASGMTTSDALSIARQIAEALEAAHEKGIIHRDLKPGNVMVTADGQVKVLDFGLGKALEAESSSDLSNSPTMTLGATQVGMILGTAAYMSPEQAKGRAADKRSDIWAFGCVLYEMLTGRRAFEGDDVSETLASVLKMEPDWTALSAELPPAIRVLIQRCLLKDRMQRIADISTVSFLLNETAALGSTQIAAAVMPVAAPRAIRPAIALAMIAAAAIVAVAATWLLRPKVVADGVAGRAHLSVLLPPGDEIDQPEVPPLALSPDGRHLVYVGNHAGKTQLYHRVIDTPDAKPIAGTTAAFAPFMSPDGQWIGFFAGGKLKKVSLDGGALELLCSAPAARGGAWGADGNIYFAPTNISNIWKIPATGGTPVEVTKLDRAQGEVSHRFPQVVQGNLIFTVWTGPGNDEKSVAVQSLSSTGHRVLVRGGAMGRYVAPGYLVYSRMDDLLALPMEMSRLEVAAVPPAMLAEHAYAEATEGADYAVSDAGVIAYVPGGSDRLTQRLVWVDWSGRVEPLPLPERHYEHVVISPDGSRAVVQIYEGVVGLWLYDFARQTLTPIATAGGSSQSPAWSSDGQRIVYRGTRKGFRNLFWKPADGTGEEERLTTKEGVLQTPTDISPDGKWVVYGEVAPQIGTNVMALPLTGDRQPRAVTSAGGIENAGQISPDGRWIAYEADQTARLEVYVQPFPNPGARIPISRNGGGEPLWSPDGRKLFYREQDKLMVVDVETSGGFSVGTPRALFSGRFGFSPNGSTSYGVSKDGKRFLFVQQVRPEQPRNEIRVVINWLDELRRAGGAR